MKIINSQIHNSEKPLYISVKDVQEHYLPMLSLKKIRKIVTFYVHTLRCGNRIIVNRIQLEEFLNDSNIENIK